MTPNRLRFMSASALRIGDLVMVEGAPTPVTEITWRNATVTINRTLNYTLDETVSVSAPSTFVPTDREVLWRRAIELQMWMDAGN